MKQIDLDLDRIERLGKEDSKHLPEEKASQYKTLKLLEELGEFVQCLLKYENAPNASKSADVGGMLEEIIDVIIVMCDIGIFKGLKNGIISCLESFDNTLTTSRTTSHIYYSFQYIYNWTSLISINRSCASGFFGLVDTLLITIIDINTILPDQNINEIIKRKLDKWESKVEAKRLLDSK